MPNEDPYIPKAPVDPILLSRARAMRSEPTSAEQELWKCLRNRQLNGFKFRRQHPTGAFIADFYCAELGLVVECDGDSHGGKGVSDQVRTALLQRDGLHVIRFFDDDVHRYLDAVLEAILAECERLSHRRPPSP